MNTDIVLHIGSFIDPNPALYSRLALVCKTFYQAFTSDKLWDKLDPCSTQTGIMKDFLDRSRANPEARKDVQNAWDKKLKPSTKEPLAWLAYYSFGYHSHESVPLITTHAMLLSALKLSHTAIYYKDPSLSWNRACACAAVLNYAPILSRLPKVYYQDKTIMMAACSKPYDLFCPLQYASPNLRDDPQLVARAVRQDGINMDFASPRLRNDRYFVLSCVKSSGDCIEFTSLFDDREVVLEAVKTYGRALRHAYNFQDDEEIVILAVEADGLALQYASARLKSQHSIVLLAVKESPEAIKFVPGFNSNIEILLTAIENSYDAYLFAAPQLQQSREFVLQAVRSNALCILHAPRKFLEDKETQLAIANQDFDLYFHYLNPMDNRQFVENKNTAWSYSVCKRREKIKSAHQKW